MNKKKLKFKIILGIVIYVLVLSILSGGSDVVKNYVPSGKPSTAVDDTKEIVYNKDVLNEVTGGYSGPPKLVKSDDRVFYIPPEYCDGQYLKNFRVIGINQSNAKITEDKEGNITDYSGAVVLYGFQTTYREDYGNNYDFDYVPYDYDTEYEVVDDYFTDSVNKLVDKDEEDNKDNKEATEETTFAVSNPLNVQSKKNKKAIDDSDFKVATVVMEHEIGKDECKILYCDADSCTVKDLDVGKYNLVTNLNDSALTVCHNEKIYVYSFNNKECSYGTNEVYYYSLNDLFDSITFKNTLADIGYCSVNYKVVGDLGYSDSSDGWVSVWLSKMSTRKTSSSPNAKYLSNLTGSTASKDKIKSNFNLDMEQFAKDSIEDAYKGYKKTGSGFLSYKHSRNVKNFGDYTYQSTGKNCWKLTSSFDIDLSETSWLVLFPKTYKGSAKGSATINITPDFKLLSKYNYSINDMILTKFDGDNNPNTNEYSIVIQMLITPTEKIEENDELAPIDDFDEYAKDVLERGGTVDSTPEGVDEKDLEERAEDDETEQEEYIEKEISAKYITLNINLAQLYGTEKSDDIEILSISDTKEVEDYFNQAKKNYKTEYDNNIAVFDSEVKKGTYVVPKDFTVESLNEFKNQYGEIKTVYDNLQKAKEELEKLKIERDNVNKSISENISATNTLANNLSGEYKINNKDINADTGYYKGLDDIIEKLGKLNGLNITESDINNIINKYKAFITCMNEINNYSFVSKSSKSGKDEYKKALNNYYTYYANNFSQIKAALGNLENIKVETADDINRFMGTNIDDAMLLYNDVETIYNDMVISPYTGGVFGGYFNNICNTKKARAADSYKAFNDAYKNVKDYTDNISYFLNFVKSNNGKEILEHYTQRRGYIEELNNYEVTEIPEKEAEIQALEAKLDELKTKYDNTKFFVDLYWNNKILNSDALINNISQYDKIIAVADEYINNFNSLLEVDDYRKSADKFISNIKTLNTDENVTRVLSDMYIGLINNETGQAKYGSAFNDLVYLYNNKTRFYADVSSAVNNIAGIKKSEVNETNAEDIKKENVNINMITEYVEKYYGRMSKNVLEKRTYSEVCSDCEKIYDELFDSFSKVIIQENGTDKEICDVDVSNVENAVYTLFLDKYGITELNDYNKDGTVAKTVTLAKNNTSQGNVYEDSEGSTEEAEEATNYNVLSSVYSGYANLKNYSNQLKGYYDGIADIAVDRLLNNGCLTEEQQSVVKVDDGNMDKDITSDYNTGYQKAVDICNEMPVLLDQTKTYYEAREEISKKIGTSINNGLRVDLRDDIYYEELYKTKCNDADHIYRLLYSAAKAKTEEERQGYVDEYNNTKWTVTDIDVKSDLSSAIVVKSKYISSTYQKVNWNTSLIRYDVESNASTTPYELYQMNSNFCIGISDNDGFIVPMGAQADVDVRSLNKKIADEIKASKIKEIENVAYGSNNNYDLLLFSGSGKWFMIAFKQKNKQISVDINNVIGYSGSYKAGAEDVHFLEYDHTNITGVNQLFSTSLENGYKPYSITLTNSRKGEITEETTAEDGSGTKGMDGAFFNSWSDEKGNVILLGFKEEDMELEEETENTTEQVISFEESAEETTEETAAKRKTRKIAETDIYDAHLYVLRYQTKKSEAIEDDSEPSIWDDDFSGLYDAGIRFEGPYGKLLEPAVNILTVALYAVLALVYALAILYCVHLGVKISKAGSDEERYEAKTHLKWFIIAVVGTHILIVFLRLGTIQLREWSNSVVIEQKAAVEDTIAD